jgi:hypothetical protein
MKLKYHLDEKGNKIYTLKNKINNFDTKDAHYKFIKIRSIKEAKKESSGLSD